MLESVGGGARVARFAYHALVIVSLGALMLREFAESREREGTAREIVTRSLAVVDESGTERLRISANLPNPRVGGQEFPRSVPAAGIQFNDAEGNEAGGIALLETIEGMALCFDHSTAEAVCLTKLGKVPFVGLTMLGPPTDSGAIGKPGPERVFLGFEGESASLVLSDSAGHPRARLVVGPEGGEPRLEFLGRDGAVQSELSPPSETK